jgi:tRNA(Arg) A34 adenosine deaminase TadA
MCVGDRRRALSILTAVGFGAWLFEPSRATALDAAAARFIAEATRLRDLAVARGDQPYGAVLVKDGVIVGHGASRVVTDRNPDAHAERVALWDAQRRLGVNDMTGTLIYSTSPPCGACQAALAIANVTRMYSGPTAIDGGAPLRR